MPADLRLLDRRTAAALPRFAFSATTLISAAIKISTRQQAIFDEIVIIMNAPTLPPPRYPSDMREMPCRKSYIAIIEARRRTPIAHVTRYDASGRAPIS